MKKTVFTLVLIFSIMSVCAASPLTDYSQGKVAIDYTYRPSFDMETSPEVSGSENIQKPVDYINNEINKREKNFSGKAKLDWGITAGLGNNWAFQYRGLKAEADGNTYPIENPPTANLVKSNNSPLAVTLTPQVKSQEFNALYKLSEGFSAFAGLVEVSPSVKVSPRYIERDGDVVYQDIGGRLEFKGEDKYFGQIGIIGTTKVWDKTNVYGVAAIGKDYRNMLAGISYEIDKNLEFDVNYRHTKFEDLSFASGYYNSSSPAAGVRPVNEFANAELKSDITVKGWGFGVTYKF